MQYALMAWLPLSLADSDDPARGSDLMPRTAQSHNRHDLHSRVWYFRQAA
jgi:hypothetical protein